jgi:hypothetical protein
MRTVQLSVGLIVIAIGVLVFLSINGLLRVSLLDMAGIALILSGLLFWAPGIAWRQDIPWLTSLFIPGSLSFALGAILMYTSQAGWNEAWYLSTVLLVALGLAFLAMYYWGPRQRWLWLVGVIVSGVGLFFLAIFLSLFASAVAARVTGSIVLIGLGVVFAFSSLVFRREHRV